MRLGRLAAGLVALTVAGCGGGEDADTPKTTPTTTPAVATGAVGPTGEVGTDGRPPGKSGDAELDGDSVQPPPDVDPDELEQDVDSPENDIPPEPGSAAERFEKYCDENPEACG